MGANEIKHKQDQKGFGFKKKVKIYCDLLVHND